MWKQVAAAQQRAPGHSIETAVMTTTLASDAGHLTSENSQLPVSMETPPADPGQPSRSRSFDLSSVGRFLEQLINSLISGQMEQLLSGDPLRKRTPTIGTPRKENTLSLSKPPQRVIAILNAICRFITHTIAEKHKTVKNITREDIEQINLGRLL